MKAAACGTWLGGIFTALIVTDMMLQDNLYPEFAPTLRKFWRTHSAIRIGIFWSFAALVTAVVVVIIVTDWIHWDTINKDFVSSTGEKKKTSSIALLYVRVYVTTVETKSLISFFFQSSLAPSWPPSSWCWT